MLARVQAWLDGQQTSLNKWHWAGFCVLLAGIVATSMGVVYTTYSTRHLLNNLQQLVHQQDKLQVEWGQLLLEQSSLVAQGQVEEIAISQLGMEVPAMDKVVVFTGD